MSFFTHGGLWSQRKKHSDLDYFGKIKIGNYTYVGEGAKIMPGISIGNDVIIGAGSIVTISVADGNPARIVVETTDFVKKIKKISLKTYNMNSQEKRDYLLVLDDNQFITK